MCALFLIEAALPRRASTFELVVGPDVVDPSPLASENATAHRHVGAETIAAGIAPQYNVVVPLVISFKCLTLPVRCGLSRAPLASRNPNTGNNSYVQARKHGPSGSDITRKSLLFHRRREICVCTVSEFDHGDVLRSPFPLLASPALEQSQQDPELRSPARWPGRPPRNPRPRPYPPESGQICPGRRPIARVFALGFLGPPPSPTYSVWRPGRQRRPRRLLHLGGLRT
jgi:hypothetical protein